MIYKTMSALRQGIELDLLAENEDPTAFFNHDHDSDEDAPPVASPSQSLSPLRQRNSQTSIGMTKTGSLGAELTSPRATGEFS